MDETPRFKEYNDATKSYAGKGARVVGCLRLEPTMSFLTPINLRVGRQVVNWGESTFIQGGINGCEPCRLSFGFPSPGAEIKKACCQ